MGIPAIKENGNRSDTDATRNTHMEKESGLALQHLYFAKKMGALLH